MSGLSPSTGGREVKKGPADMVTPRIAFAIAIAIVLMGGSAHAQATTDESAWSFSASALTYVVP